MRMPARPLCAASRRLVTIVFAAALLAGCGGQSGEQADGRRPGGGPGGRGPEVKPVPVAVTPAWRGPIASYYEATASLEAEKQAEVLARIGGVVEKIVAEEGDRVQAGDPLLHIQDDEFRFKVDQAAARTARLQAAFVRMREMRDEELASEQEFETAKSDLADAEAAEGLARLELSYATVTAPFTGFVTERLVDPGETVSNGTALFVLADFDPLLARIHVPAREFRELQVDQEVELILDSTGEKLLGKITLISPIVDPTTGTIKITVEVPEHTSGTRPGDFAQVRVVTERRPDALLVPSGAVVTDKGETLVYVVAQGERPTAERRPVTVGFTDDEHAEITAGVEPGELVVVKGQRSLKPGAPLKILEGLSDDAPAGQTARAGGGA